MGLSPTAYSLPTSQRPTSHAALRHQALLRRKVKLPRFRTRGFVLNLRPRRTAHCSVRVLRPGRPPRLRGERMSHVSRDASIREQIGEPAPASGPAWVVGSPSTSSFAIARCVETICDTAVHPTESNRSAWSVYSASADDAWAVGVAWGERSTPLVEHWDGSKWSSSPFPDVSNVP